MDVVIIPRDARLNRHENALVVTSNAGRKSIPLNGVKHVVCMGEGSISIRLLKDMGRRGIRFTVLDAGGRFLGAFEPEDEMPSGRVRIGQARLFLDEAARLRIARAIVSAQVKSMRGLLQRYRRNGTAALGLSLEGLESAIDIVDGATSIEVLMGAEGHARAFLHDAFRADLTGRKAGTQSAAPTARSRQLPDVFLQHVALLGMRERTCQDSP